MLAVVNGNLYAVQVLCETWKLRDKYVLNSSKRTNGEKKTWAKANTIIEHG